MIDVKNAGHPAEDDAKERAQIASAALILQAIVKAARGFALYLPNNPQHEKYFEELRERVDDHLEQFEELRLDIEHDSIRCFGETVYTSPEQRENLAFRMYADGIRALVLEQGLEPQELRVLVTTVGQARQEEDDDDIVTRLWAADLMHITYHLAEVPVSVDHAALGLGASGVAEGTPATAQAAQQHGVQQYVRQLGGWGPLPPEPQDEHVAHAVFTLTTEELASLQERVREDECRAPIEDVVAILEAILSVEVDAEVFGEFAETIGRLTTDLLVDGRIDHALLLVRLLDRVSRPPDIAPACVEKLNAVREEILTAGALSTLRSLLSREGGMDREALRVLVTGLGSATVVPFCQILGDEQDQKTRKVLIEALAETSRDKPELLFPFLLDARWYLVRNTIHILRRIGTPLATGAVRRCTTHDDPRVRKEALRYFDEVQDPSSEAATLTFLDDAVQSLRVSAVLSLARRRSREGCERLFAIAATPGFEARDLEERIAIWAALGELSPTRLLPVFRDMLFKRRFFSTAKKLDDIACAAAGLQRIGTPEALALLKQAAGASRGKPQSVLKDAIRAVERGGAAVAAREGEDEVRA
ncbi:MAG: hypothetical protein AB1806_19900 [Acidobacteriota bacterium]